MSILSGKTIRELGIIEPFFERSLYRTLTYGCGLAGYDVRMEFTKIDLHPYFQYLLPPGGFFLASTIERFNIPNNIAGVVHDKSSWARRGLCVQNTFLEPGWRGFLTLELTNHSDHSICLEEGMPIAQVVFHFLDQPTSGYTGKYQDQERGPQPAR